MNNKRVITSLIVIALGALCMAYGAFYPVDIRKNKEKRQSRKRKAKTYEVQQPKNAQAESKADDQSHVQTPKTNDKKVLSTPAKTGDQVQGQLSNVDDKPTYTAELQQKAEAGDVTAQLNLALCYDSGSGIEKNLVEAHKWFIKAAEQGNGRALNAVGYDYANGTGGVEKDMTEAIKWYRKSAEQGNDRGQCNLGRCYERGNGVEKDLAEAAKWYRKSAEQGNAVAQKNLGYSYHNGEGVKKDLAEAAKWFRKAAEQGEAEAQCTLGTYYHNGLGVKKDLAEAIKWFRKSAEQGDGMGQVKLGLCYQRGEGVKKDLAEAIKWFRKSAEQGNDMGQGMLGACYFQGVGVKEDIEEAFRWLSKSAKQGNEIAKEILQKPEFTLVKVTRGSLDDIEAGEACLQKLKEFKKDGRFSVETPAPRENGTLVVKGLYVGMPVDDAVVACGKIAASSDDYLIVDSRMLKDEKWSQYRYLKDKMKDCNGVCVFSCKNVKNIQDVTLLCVVRLDVDGNVRRIFFTREGMDDIFDARDLSTEEFAKALVHSYKQLPSLNKDVKNKRENGGDFCEYRWTYSSRAYNVEVFENTIIVQGREINLREYKTIMANDPNALGVAFGESLFRKYFCIDVNAKKSSGAFN